MEQSDDEDEDEPSLVDILDDDVEDDPENDIPEDQHAQRVSWVHQARPWPTGVPSVTKALRLFCVHSGS